MSILIHKNISIQSALKKFSNESISTLIVVDTDKKILGTLSNGDVRRAIVKYMNIKMRINKIYNKKPVFFFDDQYSESEARKIFIKEKYDIIPIVDKDKRYKSVVSLVDFVKERKLTSSKIIKIDAIIMAGGLGTRMAPFTHVLPKPLIPINGKTVLSHIIESFENSGIKNFWFTLNFKSNLLKAYIKETYFKNNQKFILENKPLGTIGAVKELYKKISSNFILSNCDTIIKADFNEILKFHIKNKHDITIVASLKKYNIPYGICETDEKNNFLRINEKPNLDYLVNTGLYVMSKKTLLEIPKDTKYDMNQLITKLRNKNKKIGIFPITDKAWIDVGRWSEYKKAVEDLEKIS